MAINKISFRFRLKLAKKIVKLISVIILFELLGFSAPTLASNDDNIVQSISNKIANITLNISDVESVKAETNVQNTLPANENRPKTYRVPMTAYNSEVGQTDDSPCITANGFNLCKHGIEDTVAANFLSMGTKVRIPDYFGDRIFTVRDRMNARYQKRVDVWMLNRSDALKFGIRVARVEIVE